MLALARTAARRYSSARSRRVPSASVTTCSTAQTSARHVVAQEVDLLDDVAGERRGRHRRHDQQRTAGAAPAGRYSAHCGSAAGAISSWVPKLSRTTSCARVCSEP